MTELPRYGTGWSETEALMDVIEIYNSWSGDGSPDFSSVQLRLQEKFTDRELVTLETVVDTLHKFIATELSRRVVAKGQSAQK